MDKEEPQPNKKSYIIKNLNKKTLLWESYKEFSGFQDASKYWKRYIEGKALGEFKITKVLEYDLEIWKSNEKTIK
jgi:hypothetical protein